MPIAFPFQQLKDGLINYCGLLSDSYDENWLIWQADSGDSERSKKDFIWQLYQLLLMKYAKVYSNDRTQMYQWQRHVYCEMFKFLIEEGKKVTVASIGILHCDIQLAALIGFKVQASVIANGCCSVCDTINKNIYSMEDVMKSSILPYDKCIRERGCICCYGFPAID